MSTEVKYISKEIKKFAKEIGFDACGFSKVESLKKDAEVLRKWLDQGHQAEMYYMNNHFEKRTKPALLVEDSKTVISVLLNYYPKAEISQDNNYKISKYAYGEDYHDVIKSKLRLILEKIESLSGSRKARVFVDSAPVLDRRWAQKAGLGWIGKNTCLITKENGSFYFIGEIILDLELIYDTPINDYCGSCTKCLNACPTNAIVAPYRLDARKCISYWTIENKDQIPEKFKGKFHDWIFGCDICQDVCPWNKKPIPLNELSFQPSDNLLKMNKERWESLNENQFKEMFKNSPIKRTKYAGLKRNINFVRK